MITFEEMIDVCPLGQTDKMCTVLSFKKSLSNDSTQYFIKVVSFGEYKGYEKICKFSGLDYVTDIINESTTIQIINRIIRLENALETYMSSLGGCIVGRSARHKGLLAKKAFIKKV